jgi:hypothetical protein
MGYKPLTCHNCSYSVIQKHTGKLLCSIHRTVCTGYCDQHSELERRKHFLDHAYAVSSKTNS